MFSWDPKHGGVMIRASASELMKPSLVPQSNGIKDFKNFYSQNALPSTHNERYNVEKKLANSHVVPFGKVVNRMPTLLDRQVDCEIRQCMGRDGSL